MPNVFATRNGNWSDTTVWNTSSLPTTVDDVWSNNFIVYVDGNFRVVSVRNKATTGINAGGGFILNNGTSLSANVEGSGVSGVTNACVRFLSAAPSSATIVGNVSANNAAIQIPVVIYHNGTGTLNIIGNGLGSINNNVNPSTGYIINNSSGTLNLKGDYVTGSGSFFDCVHNISSGTVTLVGGVTAATTGQGSGINNSSTGSVFVTGNVFTSTASQGWGILNNSSGQVYVSGRVSANAGSGGIGNTSTGLVVVSGEVVGGISSGRTGIQNNSVGRVLVYGNAIGGIGSTTYGILNNSAGAVFIYGNVIAGTGTTAYGAFNNVTGYLEVNGFAIGNAFGLGSAGINSAPGIFGSQTGTTIIRGLSCGARGQWPTAGNVFIIPQNTSTATLFTSASAAQVLFTSLSTNIVPPASSVRQGTVYNLNQSTGTYAIPSVSSVLQGVAVDNSVGIAALQPQTIWNYSVLSATDVDSLGGRLKEVATVQSVGQQLTALS